MKSFLTIVGTGIKFASHLTSEAKAYIQKSDKVLHLVNDPLMAEWIKLNNKNSESLDNIYFKYPLRLTCYKKITEYILEQLSLVTNLCVVMYGHPLVYAQSALDAAIEAKTLGYEVNILPGISAVDCLFADLIIDPGEFGYQSYEATDFLIRPRVINTTSHLVLWQINAIGCLGNKIDKKNKDGIKILISKLELIYGFNYEVIIYEAAQYANFNPRIEKTLIRNLDRVDLTSLSTLYIPPMSKAEIDSEMLKQLSIDIKDLKQN